MRRALAFINSASLASSCSWVRQRDWIARSRLPADLRLGLASEIIVADLSSLRNRVFVTFLLPLPFVINTWVSGNVAASVLGATTWRWGVGMWAIIYPASTLPLVTVLILARRRAQRSTHYNSIVPAYRKKGFIRALASELDIVGLFLVGALASLCSEPPLATTPTDLAIPSAYSLPPPF